MRRGTRNSSTFTAVSFFYINNGIRYPGVLHTCMPVHLTTLDEGILLPRQNSYIEICTDTDWAATTFAMGCFPHYIRRRRVLLCPTARSSVLSYRVGLVCSMNEWSIQNYLFWLGNFYLSIKLSISTINFLYQYISFETMLYRTNHT